AACRFSWRLVRFGANDAAPLASGAVPGPAVAPHATGSLALTLPANWRDADALALTAADPGGAELWTWTWPTPKLAERVAISPAAAGATRPTAEASASAITLRAGEVSAEFDAATGLLRAFRRGEKVSALSRGPRLAFARPVAAAPVTWLTFADADATALTRRLATPQPANTLELSLTFDRDQPWIAAKLELSADGTTWRTVYDSSRRPGDGLKFDFPPQMVAAVRLSGLRTADGRAVALKSMRLGHAAGRFPAPVGPGTVASGTGVDEATRQPTAWVESGGVAGLELARWTLSADGTLRLAYRYALDGEFLHHGITFDFPEEQMTGMTWLGEGPSRVWQNRMRGTTLGWHETVRRDQQPGVAWTFPEFEGYFAGVRRARLGTATGPLAISGVPDGAFLRVGTPRITHPQTMADFPAGNLSILHAIPAMGSKFKAADVAGPSGQPARASGIYSGTLTFRLGDDR
ncbi:MAG: beta-galactosidase, partial [Verrucomicrobia bacterium]|nr:beta-galactosidase [Verrucomicrobiota bacterium]